MSQYKEAMNRIYRITDPESNAEQKTMPDNSTVDHSGEHTTSYISTLESCVAVLVEHYDTLMFTCFPILWTLLFLYLMDRETTLLLWYMPVLGFVAAIIANCVPIGGGVVYVPALYLLGENMKLGVAFSLATMSIGNGMVAFLKWMSVDKKLIYWNAIPFTVIPAWKGFLVSMAFPLLGPDMEKMLFSGFCLALACFVFVLARAGGALEFARQMPTALKSRSPTVFWSITALISFLAGLILVPNIGIGPALTTFICLSLHGSIDTHAALVTGIVVGGWACWVPFAVHLFIMDDVPWQRWVMVLPGVFFGAQVGIS
jgi:uncharacterized protein